MKKILTLLALFSACGLMASEETTVPLEVKKVGLFKRGFNKCVKSPVVSIGHHPFKSTALLLILGAISYIGYEKYLEYKEAEELKEDLDILDSADSDGDSKAAASVKKSKQSKKSKK